MELQRLIYFLAVADELHFGRAAEKLLITPSPLSKQIKLLERELGGDLFVRRYHEVSLTARGAALVEPVRDILERVAALESIATTAAGEPTALRVGATPYAPSEYVDAFRENLLALDADGQISVLASTVQLGEQLKTGKLDLALLHLPVPDDTLEAVLMTSYGMAIAVRSDDPLATRTSVHLTDLVDRAVTQPVARLHPAVMRAHAEKLAEAGITQFVEVPVGTAEMANHVRSLGIVAIIQDATDSVIGRVFSAPEFATVPLEEPDFAMRLGIAWSRLHAQRRPSLPQLAGRIAHAQPMGPSPDSRA